MYMEIHVQWQYMWSDHRVLYIPLMLDTVSICYGSVAIREIEIEFGTPNIGNMHTQFT